MPLFNCTSCGVIENTALSKYWADQCRRDKSVPFNPLCSKCDPRIGEWHGRFERTYEPVAEQSLAPGAPRLLNAMRPAVPAETQKPETEWRQTGSSFCGVGSTEVEWFRPSDGIRQMYPLHFNPNTGRYDGVVVVTQKPETGESHHG